MTQYLAIALFMVTAALGIVGKLYTDKVEEFGALEVSYAQQQGEVEKAKVEIENLKVIHSVQIEKFDLLQTERLKDEVRYQQDIRRINKLRSSSAAAALKEPERFSRIATFNLRRGMRDVCRRGGGSPSDCKIEIPEPADATPNPASEPVNEGAGLSP